MAESVSLALAQNIGREAAHKLIEQACALAMENKQTLLQVLCDDERVTHHLSSVTLEKLLDPLAYTGEAVAFVDRVLTAHLHRKLKS